MSEKTNRTDGTDGTCENNEYKAAETPSPRRAWGCAWTLLAMLIALGMGWLGAVSWLQHWGRMPYGKPGEASLTVAKGSSALTIARQLETAGAIEDTKRFMLWLRLNGRAARLQAGEFAFERPISPEEVLRELSHGSFDSSLTIPEGWGVQRSGERLKKYGWIREEAEWKTLVAGAAALPASQTPLPTGALGYCFPDTYRLPDSAHAPEILDAMLRQFERVWEGLNPARCDPRSAGLTMQEIVTLASIVEREARSEDEMPAIASVYLNRLAKKMKLQCCATVRYALGDVWDRPLKYADLKIENPYNTYRNEGLPPGPICNPGRAALEAALRPAETGYLFYVYAGDGQHIYSRTYKQHAAAIKKIRRARKGGVVEFEAAP